MTCPFLKETRVKYCQSAVVRKLIPLAQSNRADEKCSSGDYASCSTFQAQPPGRPGNSACPSLRESLMQYCGAAPVTKLVPYSESLLSRCGSDSHRYCELYLSMAHPEPPADADGVAAAPEWLNYAGNHMWLDITEDGVCHAGIDAFLSRALGKIDRISYVWTKGLHRPTAVLTVDGCDLQIVFPNEMLLVNCNLYLREDPSRLAAEPYSGGWLFEGEPLPETARNLLPGPQAREWIEREERRMSEFLQHDGGAARPMAADGGLFVEGAARHLDRERRMALFHEFFSPYANEKR
jgi:glycine cleavage system H lipoate-binding protein